MAPTPLTNEQCQAAINAFLDRYLGMVHRDDVGPLFGQLAVICNDPSRDPAVRDDYASAVCIALAGDRRLSGERYDSPAAALPRARSSVIASALSLT